MIRREKHMHGQDKTTKEKLEHTIRQAQINADTARQIIGLLDRWGDKQFNKRFADALRAELGEGYSVYYSKWYDEWRLSVRTNEQAYDEGMNVYLGKHPSSVECRQRAETYAASLEADHIRAAIFEVANYDEISAEAARIALEIKAMKAKYGKHDGDFTYPMGGEVRRILAVV
jgi:hypothetical protein